jgi:hypothetical protein
LRYALIMYVNGLLRMLHKLLGWHHFQLPGKVPTPSFVYTRSLVKVLPPEGARVTVTCPERPVNTLGQKLSFFGRPMRGKDYCTAPWGVVSRHFAGNFFTCYRCFRRIFE